VRDRILTQVKRLVIKIGSSLVASRDGGLRPEQVERFTDELSGLKQKGYQVLLVSSGAIVSGIKKLGLKTYPKSLPLKQAAAAVGQSRLMWAYEKGFERVGQTVAQILLTHQELGDRKLFLNARHTLTTLIELGVIPIINENDTVAVDEIQFGDNDTLASQVAHLVDADLLVILSDVDGLYTEDPRLNPSASLIPLVNEITPDIERRAGLARTFEGTGGMATKVMAAKRAAEYGVATLILNGEKPALLPSVLAGTDGGSLFLPGERRLGSRKHWIAHTLRSRGHVTLDDGAVEALTHRGKSLLPSGIVAVNGDFDAGDAITCTDRHGKEFAKGLANFSAETLNRIKGLKSAEVRQAIGQQEYEEAIHRDNLVIL
jgi:glutamate 5-kinase